MAQGNLNNRTRMNQGDSHHGYHSYYSNKRKAVFELLDEDPLLSPSMLAELLKIPKENQAQERKYLKKLRYDWKGYHQTQRGSIRSVPDEVHGVFKRGFLGVDRLVVDLWGLVCLPSGWKHSRNQNHALIFRCGLGRVRFFRTGTVEMHVNKPANEGKAMQLFCNAFTKTGLVDSIRVVEDFQRTLQTRMHPTFDVGRKLPYVKITAFQRSHGFTMVLGDRTHPTSVEFMFEYNNEVSAAREILSKVGEALGMLKAEESACAKPLSKDGDYAR